jgi:DNA-directed RNA polymerase sigma subunit (sigma70/sigma32)
LKAKEYLYQAYRLDKRIQSNVEEMDRLRELSVSVSSPVWGERIQRTRNTDALFVRYLERIEILENKINEEIDLLVALKTEIHEVISKVQNIDERMVLRYRYIHSYTWEQIGDELNADKSTIRRWHGNALSHVVLPENPIVIQKLSTNKHI